jgi:hypothetical protein
MFTKEITETKTVIDTDKISTYDGIIAEVEYAGEKITLAGVVTSIYGNNIGITGFKLGEAVNSLGRKGMDITIIAEELSLGRAKIKHIERAGK